MLKSECKAARRLKTETSARVFVTHLTIRRRWCHNLFIELEGRFAFRVRAVRAHQNELSQRLGTCNNQNLCGLRILVYTHM